MGGKAASILRGYLGFATNRHFSLEIYQRASSGFYSYDLGRVGCTLI